MSCNEILLVMCVDEAVEVLDMESQRIEDDVEKRKRFT